MKKISALMILMMLPSAPFSLGFAQADSARSASATDEDSLQILKQTENLKLLQKDLLSSKPTVSFFYYSVACSCTAARCAIAAAAIDSIPELSAKNDSLNFRRIDAYLVPQAESLFNIMLIPAIVYYDRNGKEINRLEWGTNRQAITKLIYHPKDKQAPLD